MIRGLPLRPRAIMAGPAGAGDNVRMIENYCCKGADVVTRIAAVVGLKVGVRLGHRPALIVRHMASDAFTGRCLENSIDMARLTTHVFMRPQKQEGSRRMIKFGASLGPGNRHVQHQAQAHQRQRERAESAIRRVQPCRVHRKDVLGMS